LSEKILLISLNTGIYDGTNKMIKSDLADDPFNQFSWLEDRLVEARLKQMKAWIIQHEAGCDGFEAHTTRYLALLEK